MKANRNAVQHVVSSLFHLKQTVMML